jgi:hypothetical protein
VNTYVVVAAVRIQDWILRTPKLTRLRGASAALSQYTSREFIERVLLAEGVPATWCDEAGDIDGVVALTVPKPDDAPAVADSIARQLSAALPALELEAWWVQAPDYVSAHIAATQARLRGVTHGAVTWRPYLSALLDTPLAQTCDGCRREAIDWSERGSNGADRDKLGADCAQRRRHESRRGPTPGVDGELAPTFDSLARDGGLGPGLQHSAIGRRDSGNHLATIMADGNGVGGFMTALAEADPGGGEELQAAFRLVRQEAVGTIDRAIHEAVDAAVTKISSPDQRFVPAIVHLVGGDDVLASVPAPLAWAFVGTLGTTFAASVNDGFKEQLAQLQAVVEDVAPSSGEDAESSAARATEALAKIRRHVADLSLGIGVVFAHASYPFADTNVLAHQAMTLAKRSTRGRAGAVSWVDLTTEDTVQEGRALTLPQVVEQLDHHDLQPPVFSLSPSARGVLATILGDVWRRDPNRAETTMLQLRTWCRRTGNDRLLRTLESSAGGEAAHKHLNVLASDLNRARWWPAESAKVATR